jgi:hypothetical protein
MNSATGAAIDAILALRKNVETKKQNGISDIVNTRKNVTNNDMSEFGRNVNLATIAEEIPTQENVKTAEITHPALFMYLFSPIIFMTSSIFVSFSSTIALTNRDTGYRVDTANSTKKVNEEKRKIPAYNVLVSASPSAKLIDK